MIKSGQFSLDMPYLMYEASPFHPSTFNSLSLSLSLSLSFRAQEISLAISHSLSGPGKPLSVCLSYPSLCRYVRVCVSVAYSDGFEREILSLLLERTQAWSHQGPDTG